MIWHKLGLRSAAPLPQAPEITPFDVTAHFTEIDLGRLQVIHDAPVWMSRSERLLLYTLAFTLRPARYLEIGTLEGGSALIVVAALDALQAPGSLVCVDPSPRIAPEHWARLCERTQLVRAFSPAALDEAGQVAGGLFDLVLIDGDHSYAGALQDLVGVLPHCANGATILCHDCFNPDVKRAIDEVAQSYAVLMDFGPLTRECTVERTAQGSTVPWGGLRMLQVRR